MLHHIDAGLLLVTKDRVWGFGFLFGFRVLFFGGTGLGFRVWGLGFSVRASGFLLGFRV